jgi:hypothetical protein
MRESGWHRILRNYVGSWTVLSRVQRVLRACTAAQIALQETIQDENRAHFEEITGIQVPEPADIAAAHAAADHFQEIANEVTGNITEMNLDAIRRSFRSWANNVAEFTETDYDRVVEALSEALTEPEPQTGGTLAEQLQELHAWVPDEHIGEVLADDELEMVLQVCDNVRAAVRDERHQREWQYDVLTRLRMPRRRARDAARDRSLTEILIANEHEAAVDYLERFYDFNRTSAGAIERTLNAVANEEGATERRQKKLPTTENRLARKIRLGRRTNA